MTLPAAPTTEPLTLDLAGDRAIEWSWVSARIPDGPGYAIDFGPGGSQLSTIAALKGFDVVGVDMLDVERPFLLPNLRFLKGDINALDLPDNHFHLVINCSTVEHSGVSGRYNIDRDEEDADLRAMAKLRSLMRPGGVHLLTIPVGQDAVWRPLHRVYGPQRLPRLLDGYAVIERRAFTKDLYNRWVLTDLDEALRRPTQPTFYGLGCFILQRDDTPGRTAS